MPAQVLEAEDANMDDAPPVVSAIDYAKDGIPIDIDDHGDHRTDPDAQTTVTDFLDFTEYLPSDMMRSLTLIGNLDQTYADSSIRVHNLTKKWGQLPTLPSNERPSPVQLRADISEHLNQAVSSRGFAHAEAVRMAESVNRHYNKAKILLSKLQTMMDSYPTEEEQLKSPTALRSPQATRKSLKGIGEGGERRKARIPKITVPGEVLAPYDIEYDTCTDGTEESSEEDDDIPAVGRRTPAPAPRIKIVTGNKPQKSSGRSGRAATQQSIPSAEEIAAHAAALLRPPPENAVIGSSDAPWLQLTEYELAKLRKRMKKNATWTPSETMVARELRALGRGPEDYKQAKQKAEEEGKPFEPIIPASIGEDASGVQKLPIGAISANSVAAEEVPTSNRGMKLNEAKKLKREALAKQAAEEGDESTKKEAAAQVPTGDAAAASTTDTKDPPSPADAKNTSRSNPKRKREDDDEAETPAQEETPSARPHVKRTKTETPVPPPQLGRLGSSNKTSPTSSTPAPKITLKPTTASGTKRTETPVPVPIPPRSARLRAAKSPTPNTAASIASTVTTSVPTKPPGMETPVPIPRQDRRKSTTPIVPPSREMPSREAAKRETRGDTANRTQSESTDTPDSSNQQTQPTVEPPSRRSSSRGPNPAKTTPAPEPPTTRRPGSRGKATSQEPQPSLASDRPRRASTARNTPAPEARPPSRRAKRPAPGIVSTTSSGGSAAVGKRKAAPRKKARMTRKEKDTSAEVEMEEEVDDEGNLIDPDEPRYCLCNRVSFGTMIQCDNVDVRSSSDFFTSSDTAATSSGTNTRTSKKSQLKNPPLTQKQNCKQEWFHLECVGLENIPARTTKWYCPDCRKALNLGEKGEVSARGVRK